MNPNKTIIALATPKGRSAIAVIRISGENAFEIVKKISHKENFRKNIFLSWLVDENKNKFEQALITLFEAPHSYTGENIAEISCHGNPLIVEKTIGLCLHYGAVLASPGEFTQRAYLNGKLSLSQSEAVKDLINARSERLLKAASRELTGELQSKINEIKNIIFYCLGVIHGHLDFPLETHDTPIDEDDLFNSLNILKSKVETFHTMSRRMNILREGIKTVILGRPNVGKSSLLNFLCQTERAIVSDIPGTTRDFIQENILMGDIPLTLIDTAGLRSESTDHIENLGIEKTKELAQKAELIIFVFDSSVGWTEDDESLWKLILDSNPEASKIILANKNDISTNNVLEEIEVIKFSTKSGEGKKELEISIIQKLSMQETDEETSINQRQAACFQKALEELKSIEGVSDLEIISIVLNKVLSWMNEVDGNGQNINQEVINSIFSEFCIGK
jgi:tRNA modification GTPase